MNARHTTLGQTCGNDATVETGELTPDELRPIAGGKFWNFVKKTATDAYDIETDNPVKYSGADVVITAGAIDIVGTAIVAS